MRKGLERGRGKEKKLYLEFTVLYWYGASTRDEFSNFYAIFSLKKRRFTGFSSLNSTHFLLSSLINGLTF